LSRPEAVSGRPVPSGGAATRRVSPASRRRHLRRRRGDPGLPEHRRARRRRPPPRRPLRRPGLACRPGAWSQRHAASRFGAAGHL